jgi:hypothetical protein
MENEEAELLVGSSNALNGHPNANNGAGSSAASPAPKLPSAAPKIAGVRNPTARSHARVLDLLAGGLTRSEKTQLWVCEFCFKYMSDAILYEMHRLKCTHTHPPGQKVYQRGAHSIWEVDGAVQKVSRHPLLLYSVLMSAALLPKSLAIRETFH